MANILGFLLSSVIVVMSEAISCNEYGAVSECTDGFSTLFRIDKLETDDAVNRLTNLVTEDERQVVIPDINFACNGVITSVVVGAEWRDITEVYTELQIWRRNSTNVYMKIGGSNISAAALNDSEVYEIALNTPLAFQEGDILGYFQPESQISLYLETSGRIRTYYTILDSNDLVPPANGEMFTISTTAEDTKYPLIAVRTDPPNCGCGFMSVERVYALLNIPPLTGNRRDFNDRHMIFPNIAFTCSGDVVKWIMAGRFDSERNQYPQLEIWRQSGGNTYERLNSTVISAASEEDGEVYEYPVDPPLPFQPGDILGVLQPHRDYSRLRVRYDNDGDSVYYYTEAEDNADTFNINSDGVRTRSDLPLITVEIVQACC